MSIAQTENEHFWSYFVSRSGHYILNGINNFEADVFTLFVAVKPQHQEICSSGLQNKQIFQLRA